MLVHDLRHPLSSLGLLAEVLEAEDLSPDERHSATQQMRTMCGDMARLIDGVLAASRLEAGVFTVETRVVTVGSVIDATLKVFAPVATRRRVTLAFEGARETLIVADAAKLRQALDNLVANALKFTPKGGASASGSSWRRSLTLVPTGAGAAPGAAGAHEGTGCTEGADDGGLRGGRQWPGDRGCRGCDDFRPVPAGLARAGRGGSRARPGDCAGNRRGARWDGVGGGVGSGRRELPAFRARPVSRLTSG